MKHPARWWGAAAGIAAGAVAHSWPSIGSIHPLRRALLPSVGGVGRTGHIALTFDDGPDPLSTPAFLTALEKLGIKATFFMLGIMVDRHPELALEVAAAGHEIALHGYEHRNHLWRGPLDVIGDMRRSMESLQSATDREITYFRPPYGVLTAANVAGAKLIGVTPMLWTAWGRDWRAEATPTTVTSDVMGQLRNGGTVLLHDSDCTSEIGTWRSALGALPLIANEITSRGWTAGPLLEHFATRPRPKQAYPRGRASALLMPGGSSKFP